MQVIQSELIRWGEKKRCWEEFLGEPSASPCSWTCSSESAPHSISSTRFMGKKLQNQSRTLRTMCGTSMFFVKRWYIQYAKAVRFTTKNHRETITSCVCKDGRRSTFVLSEFILTIFHLLCKMNQMLQLNKTRHTKLTRGDYKMKLPPDID